MRWSEERYVRVYKRDTADWIALSFDAQGLFCLLLRKVDIAGNLELGKQGPKAVAVVLGQVALWESRLKGALDELLADGCVVIAGGVLTIPNYVTAQEAVASTRLRSKDYRDRHSDRFVTKRDAPVTKSDASVTQTNAPSPLVTPSLPSQPSLKNKDMSSADAPDVARVFSEWQRVMGKPAAKLTPKRTAHVRARLRDGYSVERLISAIQGCKRSAFHQGQNDRNAQFNDLELICRTGEQVEKFEALMPRAAGPPAAKPKTAQELEAEASAEFEREWRLKNG